MGAAFFSPGTIQIRSVLDVAFGQFNIASNAAAYRNLFHPQGSHALEAIIDTMDIPPANDLFWPKLHQRFHDFLKTLRQADPTTHTAIKTAMYGAMTATPAMPMQFHVAHQDAGYTFISWTEDDEAAVTWLHCLLYCPTMPPPLARRLRRAIIRRRTSQKGSSGKRRTKK